MALVVADESKKVVTQSPVQPGRCLSLNGVDQYVRAQGVPQPTFPFTMCAWFNKNVGVDSQTIFALSNASFGYFRIYLSNNAIQIQRRDTNPNAPVINTNVIVTSGKWHHVGLVLLGATHVKCYLDGALIYESDAAVSVPIAASIENFTVGAVYYNAGAVIQYYSGKVFDARYYNREITASEFANIFNTGRPGGRPQDALYADNLVGHWKLDEGRTKTTTATIAYDSSGNGHHGGLVAVNASIRYTGEDVPFSWENEVGHSELGPATLPTDWTTRYDIASWTTWTATGAASTALTNQEWDGETGLYAARFSNGAVGGYSNNRVVSGVSAANLAANKVFIGEVEIAFSRPLAAGESFRCYFVGSITGPLLDIDASDVSSTKFVKYLTLMMVSGATWSSFFAVLPLTNVTGGDITIFVKVSKLIETDIVESDNGPLDAVFPPEHFPQNSSVPAQDIFGNALTYPGPLARQAKLLDSNCGTFDGVDDWGSIEDPAFAFTGDYSVTCRVYITAHKSCAIASRWAPNLGWIAAIITGRASMYRDAQGVSGPDIPTGKWVNLGFVASGTSARFFIDGKLAQVGTFSASTHGAGGIARLGTYSNPAQSINGSMMDVRVFDRALTDAEAIAITNGGEINQDDPLGHWPFSEGDGDIAYDVTGNGHHATLNGHSRATFWGTKQSVYHRNIQKGFRIANANGSGRTFNGSQYFILPDNDDVSVNGNVSAWFAAFVKLNTVGATQYVLSKYNSALNKREWALYISSFNRPAIIGTSDGTSNLFNLSSLPTGWASGDYAMLFGYHDAAADEIGISADGEPFVTQSYSFGIANLDASLLVSGRNEGAADHFTGEILLAAMGKPTGTPDWAAIRDAIYNNGTPLTFEQLTDAQKAAWGITLWCDCDEFEPNMRDKMNDYKLVGTNMPRIPALNSGASAADGGAITNPAGAWHNGAETELDFTGGVSAPFTDKMYLGYMSGSVLSNGPDVFPALDGNFTDVISFYAKFRNYDNSIQRSLFGIEKTDPIGSRLQYLLRTNWTISLYDGQHNEIDLGGQSAVDDGNWHELVIVWQGTVGTVYFDSELKGTAVLEDLATATPNWDRARILTDPSGGSNRFSGDIARIVIQNIACIPSTILSGTPILDIRFDNGRIADVNGNLTVVHSLASTTFPKTTVPTTYGYGDTLPEGMSKGRSGIKESKFSLFDVDR